MIHTIFLDELSQNFTVSYLTLEYYAVHLKPEMSDKEVLEVMEATLKETCGVSRPTEADMHYLLECLKDVANPEESAPAEPKVSSKTFNSSFMKFMQECDTAHILGFMTGFDKAKMRELYCHTDFRHVRALAKSFINLQLERNLVAFEACMYGQGNHYKADTGASKGDVNRIDATTKEGVAQLSQFGFGSVSADLMQSLGVNLEG